MKKHQYPWRTANRAHPPPPLPPAEPHIEPIASPATIDRLAEVREASRTARLGIRGLPADIASLAFRLVYAVEVADSSMRLLAIAHTLQASLQNDQTCVLILNGPPRSFLRKARLAGVDLDQWIESGRLRLFSKRPEAMASFHLESVHTLIEQVDECLPERCALVVLETAEVDFCLPDPATVARACELYTAWAERSGHTLLAFFDPNKTRPKFRPVLKSMLEGLGGYARIESRPRGFGFEALRWCGALGPARLDAFEMDLDDSRALCVPPPTATERAAAIDSFTGRLIATADALDVSDDSIRGMPGVRVEETITGIASRLRNEHDCVALVHFRQDGWEALLGLLLTMMALRRPGLRLIVRERTESLRSYQTAQLLRLGVAAIVPRGFSDAHVLMLLTADAHGAATPPFSRPTALPGLPSDAAATLPPQQFRALVEQLLQDWKPSALPQTLMMLPLPADGGERLQAESAVSAMRDVRVCHTGSHLLVVIFCSNAYDARLVWHRSAGQTVHSVTPAFYDDAADIRRCLSACIDPSPGRPAAPVTAAAGEAVPLPPALSLLPDLRTLPKV